MTSEGQGRVVTRYMGSGITVPGSDHRPGIPGHKSWDQDQPFFVCVFEGSGIAVDLGEESLDIVFKYTFCIVSHNFTIAIKWKNLK